jgi:hypothetical protein
MTEAEGKIMIVELTVKSVTDALLTAVGERGNEYVYTNGHGMQAGTRDDRGARLAVTCSYVHNAGTPGECPGCIVGYVLAKHGVSLSVLSQEEGGASTELLKNLRNSGVLDCDSTVSRMLDYAQQAQDIGKTWHDAVLSALSVLF